MDIEFLNSVIKRYVNTDSTSINVLDCCCGNGRHALGLAANDTLSISAIDDSPHLISDALDANQYDNLDFICDDFRNYYNKFKFDFIYFMHDISLITYSYLEKEEIKHNFKHICNLLKPGGVLIFGENKYEGYVNDKSDLMPEVKYPDYIYRELFEYEHLSKKIIRHISLQFQNGSIINQKLSYRVYTREEIQAICNDHGLKLVQCCNTYDISQSFHPNLPGMILIFKYLE